ncbi:MAG: cobalamin-dependent protein [Spirochaetia bacterium]|jgi:hypothetical protein|nr:cobalamin-dependent protein [Spirochaetia bacterium]
MYLHKTVLVSCHILDSPQAIPLAAAILKSYQPYKEEVIIKDFYLNDTPQAVAETVLKYNPDSIGFSMYIWNRDFLVETASIIKGIDNKITIYAGGAEITASALSFMSNNNFDYLVRGEGELPFSDLLKYLIGKDDNQPDKLLKMSYVNDLELIPSPFLNSNLDPGEWDGILWKLSRGCPYNCSFCSESRGVKGVRYYGEERIQQELILFEKKKVNQVFVLDPTFNINKDRALGIIKLIKENSPNHLDIFRLSIFPGTVLYEQADSFNLKFKNAVPYSVISSPEYSEADLDESEKIAQAVDLFYNKGKSAGWVLSIVDVLDIAPAQFFIEFSTFLIKNSDYKDIFELQYKYLELIFRDGFDWIES